VTCTSQFVMSNSIMVYVLCSSLIQDTRHNSIALSVFVCGLWTCGVSAEQVRQE
jgi:hypothetical protein